MLLKPRSGVAFAELLGGGWVLSSLVIRIERSWRCIVSDHVASGLSPPCVYAYICFVCVRV